MSTRGNPTQGGRERTSTTGGPTPLLGGQAAQIANLERQIPALQAQLATIEREQGVYSDWLRAHASEADTALYQRSDAYLRQLDIRHEDARDLLTKAQRSLAALRGESLPRTSRVPSPADARAKAEKARQAEIDKAARALARWQRERDRKATEAMLAAQKAARAERRAALGHGQHMPPQDAQGRWMSESATRAEE